ncbi:TetR/AcrR family transcriptional regulator [Streptomyces sp. bgisy031]|uniref:TetR/AcrR family transcriptional regulator n=1 Tax=Streptomyces sp. bgisy031 TaxID=3413772 RepID=UPI003D7069DC
MEQRRTRTGGRGKPKDPDGNKAAILAAAVAEFADRGLRGGRVNAIAQASGCDKQLLYYYFKSKERLYIAALEHVYAQARQSQARLVIDDTDPLGSLHRIILTTFDLVVEHPDISRLITNENIEKGQYLRQSSVARNINQPVLENLSKVLQIGASQGKFRPDVDALELHQVTSALTNHYITNAYTLGYLFDIDFESAKTCEKYRETIRRVVSGFVAPTD